MLSLCGVTVQGDCDTQFSNHLPDYFSFSSNQALKFLLTSACGLQETQPPISTEPLFYFSLAPFLSNGLCCSKRKKSGIHLLQATHQILFVLLCVVGCSSGVIHSFYFFLLPKLLLKQEMTVAPRRLNWGDTQMFILHYFSLPWQFL